MNKTSVEYYKTPKIASNNNSRGYRRVTITLDGVTKVLYEHRIIFAYHYGVSNLLSFECIDHIDGDKQNNDIENLRGSTIRENTKRAEELGLFKRTYGDINGMCKLSKEDVDKIRKLYYEGINQYAIAEKFRISQGYVSEIINKKSRIYK